MALPNAEVAPKPRTAKEIIAGAKSLIVREFVIRVDLVEPQIIEVAEDVA